MGAAGCWNVGADYWEHAVPFGAEVVNYRKCDLCTGDFLPDSSGSDICGRELCRAVKIAWAKAAAAEMEGRKKPVLPNKLKNYHKNRLPMIQESIWV